ncbi:hypothetical protein VPH35_050016 [Triticum aestivum]|uniref:uncharacterized protein n=1 Tax=Triticum aestivum TaxID=4565 RepID=UPI001D022790|nr:uncharacterized protein LOC123068709 [Triticum aestivum]
MQHRNIIRLQDVVHNEKREGAMAKKEGPCGHCGVTSVLFLYPSGYIREDPLGVPNNLSPMCSKSLSGGACADGLWDRIQHQGWNRGGEIMVQNTRNSSGCEAVFYPCW